MAWRDSLIKLKVRYKRGKSWYHYVDDAIPILLLVGVFGLAIGWFVVLLVVYIVSVMTIGFIDYKRGIWLKENRYTTQKLNPFFNELGKDVKAIKEKLKA